MGESRRRRALKVLGGAAAASAFAYAMSSQHVDWTVHEFHNRFVAMNPDSPPARVLVDRLFHATGSALGATFLVLVVATALLPLGYVVRTVARARVRAGGRDIFAAARRWAAAHPSWTRALTALPSAALAAWVAYRWCEMPGGPLSSSSLIGVMALWSIPSVFAAVGWTALTRAGLRALVVPVVDDEEAASTDVAGDEISFDAVAVTRETRAAIGVSAALTVAMVAWLASLTPQVLFHDPRVFAAMASYFAVVLGGAALFRRASRVAIGLDGVFVTGSSRTRFFAFRDLDYAHAEGNDLVLVRGTKVVLRLQLHGKDAARRRARSSPARPTAPATTARRRSRSSSSGRSSKGRRSTARRARTRRRRWSRAVAKRRAYGFVSPPSTAPTHARASRFRACARATQTSRKKKTSLLQRLRAARSEALLFEDLARADHVERHVAR